MQSSWGERSGEDFEQDWKCSINIEDGAMIVEAMVGKLIVYRLLKGESSTELYYSYHSCVLV